MDLVPAFEEMRVSHYKTRTKLSAKQKFLVPLFLILAMVTIYFALEHIPFDSELSPARKLEGTWKTPFAVKFYFKNDFDTGEYQDVGSQDRMITWIITATSDENIVDIEMRFNSSNTQITSSGWIPDVSPMYYQGLISSSHLTLLGYNVDTGKHDIIVGEFDFTAYFIEGTWNEYWELLGFKFGEYTESKALKLNKQ